MGIVRQPAQDDYRQQVVRSLPEGKYSIVSLVWRPGQATPVHDHRCWCVVGVLQGTERETRFELVTDGVEERLVVRGTAFYGAGEVCRIVPPEEGIHKVENGGRDGLTISIHVYGADIARVGTSINRVFDHAIVTSLPDGWTPAPWRRGDEEHGTERVAVSPRMSGREG